MNLSDNLKKIRKDNNLSQEQLAEKLGVSRQSVSKWESGQAYPEMDKVLQIAKLFNLNIDDLLNQDIKEVNNEKQTKLNINKYIDDFLSFITKTIDMFSSMKFKDKIKCIIEQIIIIGLLMLVFIIISLVCKEILHGLVSLLPENLMYFIESVCGSLYLILVSILGFVLVIHIFKVRYLDYYVIVKENKEIEEDNKEKLEDKKIYLEKKEKVIIRDPKHSGYKFVSGILKCLLYFTKGIAFILGLVFSITLVSFVFSLIVSFLIIKTGLFFLGIFIILLSCIIVNLIILSILFNFKISKKKLLITFITSLFILGIGIGTTVIGFTSFDYINDINNEVYSIDEFIIQMEDDLIIDTYSYFEYVEEDRDDIKIIYKHTKYYDIFEYSQFDNYLYIAPNIDNNFLNIFRQTIKDINDKKIIDYSNFKIYIYTSKENIKKLKNNYEEYLKANYYE